MKIKRVLVFIIFSIFLAATITIIIIAPSKYVVPVIMYHNIDENVSSSLSVSPKSFGRQMQFLKNFGYNVISLEELISYIRDRKPLKARTIAITLDDGFKNNYMNAYPVLKEYNLPATIFVIVNNIGKEGFLNWNELQEMSLNNIAIGSHTLNHAYLTSLDLETLNNEVAISKKMLEEKIGKKVNLISYPLGGFNERVRGVVRKAGYLGACATNPGKRYPNNDIYALKRIRISKTSDNLFVFWIETSGFYTWIKEHRDED